MALPNGTEYGVDVWSAPERRRNKPIAQKQMKILVFDSIRHCAHVDEREMGRQMRAHAQNYLIAYETKKKTIVRLFAISCDSKQI